MERYQRVTKPRSEAPIKQNEVRITTQGLMRNYISYALTLLQDKNVSEIVLKAMGRAINKTVLLAEILKRKEEGLYQDITINSVDITDTWEPLEEGLLPIQTARHVSIITITLSKKELDVYSSGYQAPSNLKKVQTTDDPRDVNNENYPRSASRGRGQGGAARGQGRRRGYYNNGEDNYYNGRGGDGGRGYNGGGRGYYKGYDNGNDNRYSHGYENKYSNGNNGRYDDSNGNSGRYDNGGYNGNWPVQRGRGAGPSRGRGRGRARGGR